MNMNDTHIKLQRSDNQQDRAISYRKHTYVLSILLLCAATAQGQHRALRQGDKLYDQQDYTAAAAAYREAGNAPLAVYNMANAIFQQGKYADAVEYYQQALAGAKTSGDKTAALYNLGNAYLKQQKWAEAIQAYEQSLRLRPNAPDAKKNLQIAKRQLQKTPPPPPPPPNQPPPPPPPPPVYEKIPRNYLDQSQGLAKPEPLPVTRLPEATARQLLEQTIKPSEQQNARRYRETNAAPQRTKGQKDW